MFLSELLLLASYAVWRGAAAWSMKQFGPSTVDPKSQTPLKEMGISGELITVIKQILKSNSTFLPSWFCYFNGMPKVETTEAIDSEFVCQYSSWTNAINPITTPSDKEQPCEIAEREHQTNLNLRNSVSDVLGKWPGALAQSLVSSFSWSKTVHWKQKNGTYTK